MLIANRMGWNAQQTNTKSPGNSDEISSAISGDELRKRMYKRIDSWKWNA